MWAAESDNVFGRVLVVVKRELQSPQICKALSKICGSETLVAESVDLCCWIMAIISSKVLTY